MVQLSSSELEAALAELPGWRALGDDAIGRELTFPSFAIAIAFMTAVALFAERTDHHPEWTNVYRSVSIRLTTHSEGGVTDRDIALARHVAETAERLGATG